MASEKTPAQSGGDLTVELARVLGSRRTARLRRIMRHTGLPPEVLLDLAIELLDIAVENSRPLNSRTAVVSERPGRKVSPRTGAKRARRAGGWQSPARRNAKNEGDTECKPSLVLRRLMQAKRLLRPEQGDRGLVSRVATTCSAAGAELNRRDLSSMAIPPRL